MQKHKVGANNQENVKIPNNYKHSCPSNKKSTFATKPDRAPLAVIQGSNHAINKAKSKSISTISSCTDISSPIKFVENIKLREAVHTKMGGPPLVVKAPPKIKVRLVKSLKSKSTEPLVARKASPCRCLFYAESASKEDLDDFFLPPTTSTVISRLLKPEQQPCQIAKSTGIKFTPTEASTVKVQPNSTKPIPRSTLDSYTSIITLPATREESSLLERSSISEFSKITLETSQDTVELSTPDSDSMSPCKVTARRDTLGVGATDETLVDADFFCKAVKSNVPLRRSNSDVPIEKKHLRKPAVKTSFLLKRRSSTIKREIYFPILYSPEYSEGIIKYLYLNKNNNLLQNNCVTMYIDKRQRTDILNWLLEVSEHYFPQFEAPYNMAVRLMDYIIVKSSLHSSQYQLAAIAALWIAGKFLDGNPRLNRASKLFALCSGKYSTIQILAMEWNILTTVDFCLNLPDPLDFLFNYLELSNLENDEKLILSSKFIIHCASLFESYCLVTPSFLAASALYMSLQVVRNETAVYVHFLWYEPERIKYFIQHVLKVNVKYSLIHQYAPVRRYKEVARLYFNI